MIVRYLPLANPPRAWTSDSWDAQPDRPSATVHETDPTPIPTGLLDASGTPLYRVQERVVLWFQGRGR